MGDVLGKIKGDPDIERDRGIQTREDQLGYCEKRCIFFSLKYEIGGKILCSVLDFWLFFAVRDLFLRVE